MTIENQEACPVAGSVYVAGEAHDAAYVAAHAPEFAGKTTIHHASLSTSEPVLTAAAAPVVGERTV